MYTHECSHSYKYTLKYTHIPVGTNLNRDLLAFLLPFPPSISSFLRMVLWSEACAHLSEQALLCPSLVQAHHPPTPSPCCHPHQAGPAKLPRTKQLFLWRPMTRGVASSGKCFKKYFHVVFSPFWGLKKKKIHFRRWLRKPCPFQAYIGMGCIILTHLSSCPGSSFP